MSKQTDKAYISKLNREIRNNSHKMCIGDNDKLVINLFKDKLEAKSHFNGLPIKLVYTANLSGGTLNNIVHTKGADIELPPFKCGNGFKHNYQQFLVKDRNNENLQKEGVSCNYTYVDASGNSILFQEKYYYINSSDTKVYLSPCQISILPNGDLRYITDDMCYKVQKEILSESDFVLHTRAEEFKNIEIFSIGAKEMENLKQQIFNIHQTLTQYLIDLDYKQKYKELLEMAITESNDEIVNQPPAMGVSKTSGLFSGNKKFSFMHNQLQIEKLNLEIEQLNKLIENCDYQLERLEYQVNKLEKQVPTYFISNKEGTLYMGFAKYREDSLCKVSNENNQDNPFEIYRLVLIKDLRGGFVKINYEDKVNNDFCILNIVDADNNLLEFKYNSGLLSEIIVNKVKYVMFKYDDLENLVEILYQNGMSTKLKYLCNGFIDKVLDCSDFGLQFRFTNKCVTNGNWGLGIFLFGRKYSKVNDFSVHILIYIFFNFKPIFYFYSIVYILILVMGRSH